MDNVGDVAKVVRREKRCLIYGEHRKNTHFSKEGPLRLEDDIVKERTFYEHVGIRVSIYENDNDCVSERFDKSLENLSHFHGNLY